MAFDRFKKLFKLPAFIKKHPEATRFSLGAAAIVGISVAFAAPVVGIAAAVVGISALAGATVGGVLGFCIGMIPGGLLSKKVSGMEGLGIFMTSAVVGGAIGAAAGGVVTHKIVLNQFKDDSAKAKTVFNQEAGKDAAQVSKKTLVLTVADFSRFQSKAA